MSVARGWIRHTPQLSLAPVLFTSISQENLKEIVVVVIPPPLPPPNLQLPSAGKLRELDYKIQGYVVLASTIPFSLFHSVLVLYTPNALL
jgi:hypothetical protein